MHLISLDHFLPSSERAKSVVHGDAANIFWRTKLTFPKNNLKKKFKKKVIWEDTLHIKVILVWWASEVSYIYLDIYCKFSLCLFTTIYLILA